jgi:hypothetical protein
MKAWALGESGEKHMRKYSSEDRAAIFFIAILS